MTLSSLARDLKRSAAAFRTDARGAVALVFALAAFPVVGLTGASLDYSRAADIRSVYQDAADAAALAAATTQHASFDAREAFARDVFNANVPDGGHVIKQVDLFEVELGFEVRAQGDVDTTLLEVMGIAEIGIAVSAIAAASQEPLEISFVIDATNSMNFGNRWETAHAAMELMLETLKDANTDSDALTVTAIPMGDRVNVGVGNFGWVDFDADLSDLTQSEWQGCVHPREEPIPSNPYQLTNATPAEVPFIALDHRYKGGIHKLRWYQCPQPIVGPTHNVDLVIDHMELLLPAGTGRFDSGMAWAWRSLTPNWSGEWGLPNYPAPQDEARKVVVFISDGNSTMEDYEFDGHSEWGWNNSGAAMFDSLLAVCEDMHDAGVTIYMLYIEGNPYAEQYFRDCASSDQHYFDVTTNEAMESAFQSLGASLIEARLIQ